MPRKVLLTSMSLALLLAFTISMVGTSQAGSSCDMKSLVIVSGYGGYTTHELDKASDMRDHLLESCSEDDIYYLTDTSMSGSDGEATKKNVEDAFSWLIENCDKDTRVAVYIMDHVQVINGVPQFRFNDGNIKASTMDGWLDDVDCCEMTVILNGERSALAGPSLDTSSRDVICSMGSSQTYCPDNFDIARSLDDPDADTDDDGVVTYIEAYHYEKNLLASSGQDPVLY